MQRIVYKTPTKRHQAKTKVNTIWWALLTYTFSFSSYLILNCNILVQDIYVENI